MKNKSYAVFGLGRFGKSVAETLNDMGYEVLVVDKNEDCINAISPNIAHAIVGNAADEHLLNSIGVNNFDVAIVCIGEDIQSSILLTLLLKEKGVKYILAKAQNEKHEKVLYKVGADKVIQPERDMGARTAHSIVSRNIQELFELSPEISIVEIVPPKSWTNKSLSESKIRDKHGISIVAIKKPDYIDASPRAEYVIKPDDILVIVGSNENIRKLSLID
jgi:trk system potassium uptake protein